jgi:solute carrier family 25 2-oxodicarboxylate transporter 21
MSSNKPKTLTFPQQVFAGGVAGITEICLFYPLDVLKTRQQVHVGKEAGSMVSQMAHILRTEGLRVYRGMTAPILVEAPKRAVKFSANGQFSSLYSGMFGKDGKPTQLTSAAAGLSAGLTEAFVVVPPELIKIRMQHVAYKGMYLNTMDCFQKVIRNEGVMALTKGLEPTLYRHGAWNLMYFSSIFKLKTMLPTAQSKPGRLWWDFVAGTISGTLGTMLNTPFDVVKSRIQVSTGASKYNWTLPSVALIAREEGVGALYKGFAAKVARLGPGGGILLLVFNAISDMILGPK